MNCTWLMGCKRIRSESSPGLERWPGTAACGNWRPPFTATCRQVWTRNAPASPLLRFSQVHALALATVACPSDSSSARSTRLTSESGICPNRTARGLKVSSSLAWQCGMVVSTRKSGNHWRCRHQQQEKTTRTASISSKTFVVVPIFSNNLMLWESNPPSCCWIVRTAKRSEMLEALFAPGKSCVSNFEACFHVFTYVFLQLDPEIRPSDGRRR